MRVSRFLTAVEVAASKGRLRPICARKRSITGGPTPVASTSHPACLSAHQRAGEAHGTSPGVWRARDSIAEDSVTAPEADALSFVHARQNHEVHRLHQLRQPLCPMGCTIS